MQQTTSSNNYSTKSAPTPQRQSTDNSQNLTDIQRRVAQFPPELQKIVKDNYLKFLRLAHKKKIWPEEIIKAELHQYIVENFHTNIPKTKVCHNHDAPFDFVYDAFMANHRMILAMGNRASGKTWDMSIIQTLNSIGNDNCEGANLGAIQAQALRCAGYIKGFIRDNPDFQMRLAADPTSTKVQWNNGSINEILVATISGTNCLSGDTLIECPRDLKHYPKGIPIKELVGKEFFTYAYDIEKDETVIRKASNVHCSGKQAKVFKLTYEWITPGTSQYNTGYIIGTAHHPILLKNGEYKPLAALVKGESLQPFHVSERKKNLIYRGLLRNRSIRTTKNKRMEEPRFIYRQVHGELKPGHDIHHVDGNHANNDPSNLAQITEFDHVKHHFGEDSQRYITAEARIKISIARTKNNVYPIYQDEAYLREQIEVYGKSVKQIGRELGVTGEAVAKFASRYGIVSAQRKSVLEAMRKNAAPPKKQLENLYFKQKMSVKDIGKDLGLAYGATLRLFQRYGIQQKSASEIKREADFKKRLLALDNHRVISVEETGYEDVYDMSVEDTHNFIANGIVVHNSPHPSRLVMDEVELIPWPILQEALSMVQSKNGVDSCTVLGSTRKFAAGPMQRLIENAPKLGIKVYSWCILDTVEPLPEDPAQRQHIFDVFGDDLPEGVERCSGFYKWSDLMDKYRSLDRNVWDTQWMCKRPDTQGLVYSRFDDVLNFAPDFKLDPVALQNGWSQVYVFEDFGSTKSHPNVVLLAHVDFRKQEVIIFDEMFCIDKGTNDIIGDAKAMIAKHGLTMQNISGWIGDPHAIGEQIDRYNLGLPMLGNHFVTDEGQKLPGELLLVKNGITHMRKFIDDRRLKVTKDVPEFRREIFSYAYKKNMRGEYTEEPEKDNDHSMDCCRTGLVWLFPQMAMGSFGADDLKAGDDEISKNTTLTAGLWEKKF